MDGSELRALAMALPQATEAPHFERSSFRIGKKVFATVSPEEDSVHIFVDEGEIRAAVSEDPGTCTLLWWGKKLSGVRVELATARPDLVAELLAEAWRRKAPKRLVAAYDTDHPAS